MGRLKTLPNRLKEPPSRLRKAPTASDQRMAGRSLQDRRWRLWQRNPHCAHCGRLVEYPHGFDMDHVIALVNGGSDTDENCQLLCNGTDGCHDAKTRDDLGHRARFK